MGNSSDQNAGIRTVDDEDEEGWASDKSGEPAHTTEELPGDHRKRRKTKSTGHPVAVRNTKSHRRRHVSEGGTFSSHARQLLEQPTELPSGNAPVEDDDQRGRAYVPHRQGSGHTSHRSIQHRRLESLKNSVQNSRDVSPARSVRFVDEEPRSGASTPRTPADQTGQGSIFVEPSSTDDSDSRGKVTFDLTHSKRASED